MENTTTNQRNKILAYLKAGNSLTWIEALNLFGSGGGFRQRITECRRELAKEGNNVCVISKRVEGQPYHVYYLSSFSYKFQIKQKAA